jgi:DNA-binding SARP family transcriptional activator
VRPKVDRALPGVAAGHLPRASRYALLATPRALLHTIRPRGHREPPLDAAAPPREPVSAGSEPHKPQIENAADMDFCILGSLEVRSNGLSVALPRGKPRALLAALLLRRNEVVSLDRLVDDLWGADPPASARQMVKGYVSDLRRDLAPATEADWLVTFAPGYRLEVDPGQVDAERFEQLFARGSEEFESERHSDAAELLREGLALWRGPALVDFTYDEFAASEIRRLEDLRLAALELRIAAELELGRHARLVGELDVLVREYPLRERLYELLMLALYRGDRGAAALEAYNQIRASLDELGLETGPALRQLQQAILRHDPGIRATPAGAAPEPQPVVRAGPDAQDHEAPPVTDERRKTVTILICDLDHSPEIAERIDTELLRRVLQRYFELAASVLQRHGGSVEKYIGNAVAAVFGMPTVHEDDSLRAIRAAFELRDELARFNSGVEDETVAAWRPRFGLNTGEVVAVKAVAGEAIFTADASNLAARLQQAAEPNEILIGEATLELVRGAVEVEPVQPLPLKGKSQPARAFRITKLTQGAPAFARQFDAPLIGRLRELAQLRGAFERSVESSSACLFTVLGPAGVGKSRLAAEARLELAGEARILSGACLSYGEGITFWPLHQMLVEAFGEAFEPSVNERLASYPDREWISSSVTRLLGLRADSPGSLEESFFAVRCLLERLALDRPLVLIFEDVHWADAALLDLIEHVSDLARTAPMLVLCLARPDLLEHRPGWAGGKPNATTLLLDPLSSHEARRLADWLLRDQAIDGRERARALELAEGNPLFIEQLCAHASESSDRPWQRGLPPTILALLAARIDRLPPAERALVERAAVVGTEFDSNALTELVPSGLRPSIGPRLDSLVRKELVRPTAGGAGTARYRFRHALVRDAAYHSISKHERAALHERFAEWLEAMHRNHEFFDELTGHHLEQAYRCRVDLGDVGLETAALADRASSRLEAAGQHAQNRSDRAAAASLLNRAAQLDQTNDRRRIVLLTDVARLLIDAGDLDGSAGALEDAEGDALTDETASARILVLHQMVRLLRGDDGAAAEAVGTVAKAITLFERNRDVSGLCSVWRLQAWLQWIGGKAAVAQSAWERAAEYARACGEVHAEAEILTWIATALWLGPTPVAEAVRRCQEINSRLAGHLEAEALTLRAIAGLQALRGEFDTARQLLRRSDEILGDLGRSLDVATSHVPAMVDLLAGDAQSAEVSLRTGYDALAEIGERVFRPTIAALLARALLEQRRIDEAEALARESAEMADPGDIVTHMYWRRVSALIHAEHGDHAAAEELVREAVALASDTDFVIDHGDALVDLADVLQIAGRTAEASKVVADALTLYELKGNVVSARRVRGRFAATASV